ncbi:MAG TPA: tetratricopeptide repeat protein [Candidatus Acidoferrales bacterium]|nr:tetratricopeptide repeat protein [Candidatus Acidoferrales bacterium]
MKCLLIRCRAILVVASVTALLLTACAGNPEKAKLNYVEKGKAYMTKKAYSSAAIEFRNALKIDPKYTEAYYQLAQAQLGLGDGGGAFNSLQSAIEIDPNRTDVRILHGNILIAAARVQRKPEFYSDAEKDANFVLKLDPQNAQAHHLLGSALTAEKKYDEALQEFSTVTRLEPTKASTYMDMGLVQIALQRWPDAEQSFRKAVELEPKSPQTYINLANCYRAQKNFSDAERVFQQGAQNVPGNIQVYLNWAEMLASEGKNSDADATLKVLRDQSPKSVDVARAIGDYNLQRNNVDQAMAEYQRGLAIDPKNLTLQQKMEDIYLSTGKTEAAAAMDAVVMKQAPNDSTNKINHGRLLMVQGKFQDAVTSLQKTVADEASSNEAHYYLGMAYWKNGNTDQANAEFQNALQISPGLAVALRALTQLNLSQGHYAVAQIYAQELLQENPADPMNRLLLGETLLPQGKNKDAEEQFLAAKQSAPNSPAAYVDLGYLYQLEQRFPDAEKAYQTALKLAPNDTSALDQYVGLLASRGDVPKAVAIAQQFIAMNPKDAHAHLTLSGIQLQVKNYTAASAEAEQATQLDPESILPYLQLGEVLRRKGDDNGAIQAYERALTRQPRAAPVIAAIGNIYLNQNDLARAGTQFQKALEVEPNLTVAQNNLAWVYAEQGQNLDVALGLAQKAKSQNPSQVTYTDTLAWVMYKKGDYLGAIPYLQDCVKKSPETGQFRYHLGMALVASGQKQQGRELLQAALKMNLDSADSQLAREALAREN